ncbi:MAG: hypothetical protein HY046_03065 [Acidobacteria bacterium]|nr:hypothetical protein [Acidobacteriota bacterium]
MKIRLNLATAPFQNHRRFLLGAGLVGAIGVGALTVLSLLTVRDLRDSRELRSEINRYSSDNREFKRKRRELEDFFGDPATKKSLDRAAFFNALIDQRSFPWTQVFTVLEKLMPTGARISSLSPKMENGRVEIRLLVGGLSDESVIEFLKRLYAAREFTNIRVVGQSHPNRGELQDKVVLELLANYLAHDTQSEDEPAQKKSDE